MNTDNKYFRKIDFVLPELDMSRILSDRLTEGYGDEFRSYEIQDMEYFRSLYSTTIEFGIPPDEINFTRILDTAKPHKDTAVTSLNYYVNSGDCITIFWKLKNQAHVPDALLSLNPDNEWIESAVLGYAVEDLKPVSYFKAASNEAYLLSVENIHSVYKSKQSAVREFFRWMWADVPMEEVLASIVLK